MVNSKFAYIICAMLLFVALNSCEHKPIDHSKLVVEGWIDAGKHPIVMLHTSYSLDASNTPDNTTLVDVLAEHMVSFGKVVLFDGKDSVTLTGRLDTNYLPPCIYTTTRIIGEIGKTYTLHASYKEFSVKSKTYVPPIAKFDSIQVTNLNDRMNVVGFANNLEIGATYILMARTTAERQYKICPMGAFRATKNAMKVTINNPIDFTGEGSILQTLFPKTDEVSISIKFAQVGEIEYQMWDSYIAQNMTQGLFFMETHSNILSNIEGGNGYWCGMGASEYVIHLDEETLYTYP